MTDMDLKLALIILPVGDIDAAKSFYSDKAGFAVDYDMAPTDDFRIVQITPPGSATSIAIGRGLTAEAVAPGSVKGLRLVVDDIDAARETLTASGVEVSNVDDRPWGRFAWFSDPDGNGWELNQPAPQG